MAAKQLLILALVAGVAAAFCPPFMKNEPACSCSPYVDGAVVKCSGPRSPAVVEKLKAAHAEIRELVIENANIVELGYFVQRHLLQIGPRAFRNLRIKNLKLDHNRIRAIHKDALRGLEGSLQTLSVSHNKLTEIPSEALRGMTYLQVLNLKCNSIKDIHGPQFRNMSSLIELNLACNQVCNINGPAFQTVKKTLQSLILDQNCLKEVPADALRNFDSLIALHLQYNQIDSIDKLQLLNLTNLLMLRLTGNKIRSIDRHAFNNVANLRYLFVDRNELSSIDAHTFKQFKLLEIVDISHNNIAEIVLDAFQGMPRLMQLNLEGNNIKDIAPGAFGGTPLLLLMLADNCLTTATQQMFKGIPFLKQLSLANNNIGVVQPFAFRHLPTLHLLDLSKNKIKDVKLNEMVSSPHATVLLQENPSICAQEGYHIIQGGQPILLLNEPNVVCQKIGLTGNAETCSKKRSEKMTPPPCCTAYKKIVLKKPKPTDKTKPIRRRFQPNATTKIITSNKAENKRNVTIRRPNNRVVTPSRKSVANTRTTAGAPTSPRRKINMDRFLRLAGRRRITPTGRTRNRFERVRTAPKATSARRRPPTIPAIPQRPVEPNDPFAQNRGPFLPDSGIILGRSAPPPAAAVNSFGQSPTPVVSNSFAQASSVGAGRPTPPAVSVSQPRPPSSTVRPTGAAAGQLHQNGLITSVEQVRALLRSLQAQAASNQSPLEQPPLPPWLFPVTDKFGRDGGPADRRKPPDSPVRS